MIITHWITGRLRKENQMPYISQEVRQSLAAGREPATAGELTYILYQQCWDYATRNRTKRNPNFMDYAIVLGCLLCTILELYRRKVAPYEDEKIAINGDVE